VPAFTLDLAISGAGAFDAGLDPAAPFTYELTATIMEISRNVNRFAETKRKIVKTALKNGKCRMRILLKSGITISQESEQFLRERVGLAWELARHQLRDVGCRHELEVVYGN
jgi:thermostable 8-oxoguanine DNA glycosylase